MSLANNLSRLACPAWQLRPKVLLCANTVKPLHGLTPRTILGQEWWDATRATAYASTEYHCIACGVFKKEAKEFPYLEGHEVYDIDYRKGRATYTETVPLCHYCHNYIHSGRLEALMKTREIPVEKYVAVMAHGRAILRAARLTKRPYRGAIAPWHKWRLVLNGIEYMPIYRTFAEWKRAFNPRATE